MEAQSLAEPRRKTLKMFDPALEYGLLPSLTGFALRRASLLDFGRFAEAVGDRAITPLRYSLLEVVGANPGLRQVQLAEILGLAKPAASLAIDFWQARKCITRRSDSRDRRSYGIYLTQPGEEKLAELQALVARHDADLTKSLSGKELQELRALLERISAGL
jgi:DNA-binding MarR family transcriptional regulator